MSLSRKKLLLDLLRQLEGLAATARQAASQRQVRDVLLVMRAMIDAALAMLGDGSKLH